MIGYRISRQNLRTLVEKHAPGWISRAKSRTAAFRASGKFAEASSIWSEVKPVYMKLQGDSKCAFCERKLESVELGKGEQAVEHFRPKGKLSRWRLPAQLKHIGIALAAPPKGKGGYHLLAYDLFNYSAACNPCNSALKRDYFPIAGKYKLKGTKSENLLKEQPLLLYPIGNFDTDPEKLIRFNGVSPYAAGSTGYDLNRALVTIEFFQLDSLKRSNLVLERARIIEILFIALQDLDNPTSPLPRKTLARSIINDATSDRAPHANCARSFCTLYSRNASEAADICAKAAAFVDSKS